MTNEKSPLLIRFLTLRSHSSAALMFASPVGTSGVDRRISRVVRSGLMTSISGPRASRRSSPSATLAFLKRGDEHWEHGAISGTSRLGLDLDESW